MSELAIFDTHDRARRVGLLPLPGFALLSYAALTEPMRAANLLARRALYETVVLSEDGGPVQSSGDALVAAGARPSEAGRLDYLFVIAGGDPAAYRNTAVMAWLARQARAGVALGGISGGPVILARAGLMAGRRMTVHWEHAGTLAEISPHLLIERTLYVIDRDRLTAAGGTAPMDMMHHLLTQHHGPAFAQLVSDWFLHTEIRPSGGPQRTGLVARVGTRNAALLNAVEAMEAHVAEPLSLSALARHAGLSPRHLNRLFRDILGRPAMRYYRDLRLEKAKSLLRNAPLSITEIALATGFANSAHFSRAFSQAFGQPPSALR